MRRFLTALAGLLILLPSLAMAASMQASGKRFSIGDVVDLEITGGEKATCIYSVLLDGKKIFESEEPDTHMKASYRPREAGIYEIRALLDTEEREEPLSCTFTVDGDVHDGLASIYSQRDGWWKDKSYRESDLDKSGCAIFTLSHALSRMDVDDPSSLPEQLGITYASCLITGGTSNVRLIGQAADKYGFQTKADLIESKNEIRRQFQDGAMFSFSIVFGHIALATELSSDGKKVQVVDSAPGVTMERIHGTMYYRDSKGKFQKLTDLSQLPECRYYLETQQYGGASYYLDFNYVAGRGVRLIKPYQVVWHEEDGDTPVELVTFGTMECEITKTGKKTVTVSTGDLTWRSQIPTKTAALVKGTKAVVLRDAGGTKLKTIPGRSVMPVLDIFEDTVRVRYDGAAGLVDAKSVELLDLTELRADTGALSLNGSTSGRAKIKVRLTPGGKVLDEYPTGTRLAVFGEKDDAYEIEIEGRRGFVQKEYVLLDSSGET